ncbi:DUF5719 family protein [Streptosporangium soli]|nr:DUF5719 family protein [Streptosporangium sp. KLBMP 9127]
MKALIENRFGLLVLIMISLAALYGVAYVTQPAGAQPAPPPPAKVAVESVQTVCPDPAGNAVSVVVPQASERVGTATITPLKADSKPLVTLDKPGVLWQKTTAERSDPLVVKGVGAMAAGLETSQTVREAAGKTRGLVGVRCTEPTSEAWVIGPGPAAADITLHLANPESAPAAVEISVYAGEGPVLADHGLVVEPGEFTKIRLKDLAPSPLVMAVEVRTSSGRVAVAARAELGTGKGADWLPVSTAPAKHVVVPGLPGGGGHRELLVAAPGEMDAVVGVKVLTEDGFYALKNRETIDVPAGSVATLDLSTGVGGQPSAVVLTSEVPVVAGVTVTGTGAQSDVAFSAGAGPIDLGSVVADNRTGKKQSSRLVLSALGKPGKVRVQVLPRQGTPPKATEVAVPASRTEEVKLPSARGPYSVVITPLPGSGPVYGGRVLDDRTKGGLLVTLQPLAPGRTWALVPHLVDSAATVLP